MALMPGDGLRGGERWDSFMLMNPPKSLSEKAFGAEREFRVRALERLCCDIAVRSQPDVDSGAEIAHTVLLLQLATL